MDAGVRCFLHAVTRFQDVGHLRGSARIIYFCPFFQNIKRKGGIRTMGGSPILLKENGLDGFITFVRVDTDSGMSAIPASGAENLAVLV